MVLKERHYLLMKRFLFLLIPYTLLRVGFYFYQSDMFASYGMKEIILAFLMGFRFDVSAILLTNLPIIFLGLIPSENKILISFERILFVAINSIFLLTGLDDFEFISFMGKRLNYDIFIILADILDILPELLKTYWFFPLVALLYGFGFYKFDQFLFKVKGKTYDLKTHFKSAALLILITAVGIRGGFESLSVEKAFFQGQNDLGHLVLNTPFHFLESLNKQGLRKMSFFPDRKEAEKVISTQRKVERSYAGLKNANVVLIILESFSLEYMEEGLTPFLDELKSRSLFYERHLANGRRSIEALPSLLCGLPSLLEETLSTSLYTMSEYECMPEALKKAGYTNSFFHGGARGTMSFDSYSMKSGFQHYYGLEDYPEKKDLDGSWGVFDHAYLNHVAEKIGKMQSPFLVSVFTLSSHHPYPIPSELQGKFKKGELEIHESIGYVDYSLRKFFEKVEKEEWAKNTLFVITGDHIQKIKRQKFRNLVGQFRVPLFLYAPGHQWKSVSNQKVTQHSDIPSTILDYTGVSGNLPPTSISALSTDPGMAVNYADGNSYYLISGDKLSTLTNGGEEKSFSYDWSQGKMTELNQPIDPALKAYLHIFMNGLLTTSLSHK